MMKFLVRIFENGEVVEESNPINSKTEGLNCLALFEEHFINEGFRVSRPYSNCCMFRAYHENDALLLDAYLVSMPQPMN